MSFSPSQAQDESLDRGAFAAREVHEQQASQAFAAPPALAVATVLVGLAAVVIALGAGGLGTGARIAGGVVTAAAVIFGVGFVVVQPNEARVLILFGRYAGSLTQRNPIEIAAVVVWRVVDTAKAVFDVADFEQFVTCRARPHCVTRQRVPIRRLPPGQDLAAGQHGRGARFMPDRDLR